MIMRFQWANVVNQLKDKFLINEPKGYIVLKIIQDMACFCGCESWQKNDDGFRVACVKCGHGPQNHDDEFRASARKNESQSQKRDADFG